MMSCRDFNRHHPRVWNEERNVTDLFTAAATQEFEEHTRSLQLMVMAFPRRLSMLQSMLTTI